MSSTPLNTLYASIASNLFGEISQLKFVDIDLGQLKNGGEKILIDYPALIIRFENVYWKEYDTSKQIGLVHVRLKIIFPYEQEFYPEIHSVRDEVGEFFVIALRVHEVMSTIPTGVFTKLLRFNENHLESKPEDMKWIYCMDYYCNIFSDESYFDEGAALDLDYTMLQQNNWVLERTNEGKKVG